MAQAPVNSPLAGVVQSIAVESGATVHTGQVLVCVEAMKMLHQIVAPQAGTVSALDVGLGDQVDEGQVLLRLAPGPSGVESRAPQTQSETDDTGGELAEIRAQHALGLDAARPQAVARRRDKGRRTARENISDLCDADSFIEYGALAIAAQRSRRSEDELKRDTPADGMVTGIGRINGEHFEPDRSRAVVMSYDYTVLAGTQGFQNHRKTDRMVQVAREQGLPVVFFAEGGGGRPGDVDVNLITAAQLEVTSFAEFARLSGKVPLVGINAGYCFAGNAAFFGCCDVTIATRDSNVGMGGPAMIEGGGLGQFKPGEIGPADAQSANGVIDILVEDEIQAVAAAKQYLGYFQGAIVPAGAPEPEKLRDCVPENRKLTYDVKKVIQTLADTDSVLELRAGFARNLVTALIRVDGKPLGVLANNPKYLAGAIDSAAADKAARFMQLCNAHGIPLLTLCDTPGIMVGPESEKAATVRHAARLFVVGANIQVPWFGIVLRKCYGLGAQAMLGGHLKRPQFTVAWPTGEFGPMGLEGAVRLGFRRELEAIQDPVEREQRFEQMVDKMYAHGKAANVATYFEVDDVIDPADSRRWLADALQGQPPAASRHTPGRGFIDSW